MHRVGEEADIVDQVLRLTLAGNHGEDGMGMTGRNGGEHEGARGRWHDESTGYGRVEVSLPPVEYGAKRRSHGHASYCRGGMTDSCVTCGDISPFSTQECD